MDFSIHYLSVVFLHRSGITYSIFGLHPPGDYTQSSFRDLRFFSSFHSRDRLDNTSLPSLKTYHLSFFITTQGPFDIGDPCIIQDLLCFCFENDVLITSEPQSCSAAELGKLSLLTVVSCAHILFSIPVDFVSLARTTK